MCRVDAISFDLEKRQGATFILCDSLQSGVISVIAIGILFSMFIKIGNQMNDAVQIMTDALNFIQKQVRIIIIKIPLGWHFGYEKCSCDSKTQR